MPRVLIVDDDAAQLRLLTRALAQDGWDAVAASSGAEALAAFTGGAFDMLLSDVNLGDADGVTLAQAIHRERPGIPVVLMSGLPENAERARAAGFKHCLGKPFSLAELRAVCRTCRARPEASSPADEDRRRM
ncbi:MAG: response regulator [Elusimicrobia bacterium]|nr:response regulator [Elusimicrobiota bacterium]